MIFCRIIYYIWNQNTESLFVIIYIINNLYNTDYDS